MSARSHPRLTSCLAILALAACLGACGGGEDAPTQSGSTRISTAGGGSASEGAEAASEVPSGEGSAGEAPGAGESEQGHRAPAGSESLEGGSPSVKNEAGEDSAAVSPRSAGFRGSDGLTKGLPEFGTEAGSGERGAAEAVLEAYLGLIAADEWEQACPYVAAEVRIETRRIIEQSERLAGEGCGALLRHYTALFVEPSTGFRDYGAPRVASLRVEEDVGFAMIHGSDGEDYWAAMRLEGDGWKLLTLVPQPFG